jgi:hypothetical protein
VYAGALLLLGLSWGCTSPLGTETETEGYALISTRNGEAVYHCGWHPGRPVQERVVADLVFNRSTAAGMPLQEDVAAITRAGAEVRHVYHVAAVRVEVATDLIPSLSTAGPGGINYAITVSDPAERVLEMQVFFSGAVQAASVAALERLGARVVRRLDARGVVYVQAPDPSIPAMRALEGVRLIRVTPWACGTAE